MKEYDILAIGTGAAASVVSAWLRVHPESRAAVIEKDTPGGICLTRGCIPSKMLTSVADVVRTVERAGEFGVVLGDHRVEFPKVMRRLREYIDPKIDAIAQGLTGTHNLDFYHEPVEFIGPYTLRSSGGVEMRSHRILLGIGSEPIIPEIPGLREVGPLTSDTVFRLEERPDRLAILGGGYIAAEFAHFFSAVGTEVTVIGRNPRFLPQEDPEISEIVTKSLGRRVRLILGRQVEKIERDHRGRLTLHLAPSGSASREELHVDSVLVAAGRGSTARALHPEKAGIRTDPRDWIIVNEYLETGQPGIWALGDATGKLPFKHKANYDAKILYRTIVKEHRTAVDYHAVPHAVFTDPEVGSVGLTEAEAVEKYGVRSLLIGRFDYKDTAKGHAIGAEEGRVKVLVRSEGLEIIGAHIVGPQASILVQEVVDLLYTPDRSARAIVEGMHIHPALSEVVEQAFLALEPAHEGHRPDREAGSSRPRGSPAPDHRPRAGTEA